ncbi:MAG: protein-L-isoaspartate O-methyltransferase family protein [Halobacteriota archaeon]
MDPAVLREDMVDGLEHAMSLSERVGVAMRTVPRHEFVEDRPYDNRPTEHDGTRVLDPQTAARLVDALAPEHGDSVLVVGAGVGYTAAVIAEIVDDHNVQAVDIQRRVVLDARQNLRNAGYDGVLVDRRNGADGLPEYAPFDRILVEAAAVRPPQRLLEQLAPGGRLVMPVGGPAQTLTAMGRPTAGDAEVEVVEEFGPVALAPMLVDGEQGGGLPRNRTEREDLEYAQMGRLRRHGWEQDWVDWDEHV